MRHSRYVWIIGVALLCLFLTISWKTPQAVITAITDPLYSDSPQLTIQRFWNFLDSRQVDLAKGLIKNDNTPVSGINLIDELEEVVEQDPLLKIQKIEFFDVRNPQSIIVKVTWRSSLHNVQTAMYSFDVRRTNQGWRIWAIKQINNIS